jgi:hypothetical protein
MIQIVYDLFGSKELAQAYFVFVAFALVIICIACARDYLKSKRALKHDRSGR